MKLMGEALLTLLPGQTAETPTAERASVMMFVQIPLESFVHMIDFLETRAQQPCSGF